MDAIEEKLRAGMTERGISGPAQEQIVKSITSFALYGFPEDLLMDGVRPFHPLDVLDAALTAWRDKAFQLNTWTV